MSSEQGITLGESQKTRREPDKIKRDRPQEKEYNSEILMRELIDTVAEIYREKKEIKAVALELALPPIRSKNC